MTREQKNLIYFPPLSEKTILSIEGERKSMWDRFKSVPEEGVEVKYLGRTFLVYPSVFWPHDDSKPLVQNFTIKENEDVLDLATGSGIIALFAALNGARKVVAVDINPAAIKSVEANAKRFKLQDKIESRESDVFSNIRPEEKFDVITLNPPFTAKEAEDIVERSMQDPGFNFYKDFFKDVNNHLKQGGRIYMSQSNFGNVNTMIEMADESGFNVELIGVYNPEDDPRIYYAFKLDYKNPSRY